MTELDKLIIACIDRERIKEDVLKMISYSVGRQIEEELYGNKIAESIIREEVSSFLRSDEIKNEIRKIVTERVKKVISERDKLSV